MKFFTPVCFSLLLLTLSYTSSPATAANFDIHNNCPYTVWAAAVPGGGRQLNNGDTWTISANPGQTQARIWARTGCTSTGPNGLSCTTGDCGGVLQCTQYGQPPNTLAEYSLGQFSNLDFFDISLIDGFNVPMSFVPISNGCTNGATCSADLNGPCPGPLRVPGGCYSSCRCGPNDNSRYFKNGCPQAYSYPEDTTLFTCPNGANYRVTFCP